MGIPIKKATEIPTDDHLVLLVHKGKHYPDGILSEEALQFLSETDKREQGNPVHLNLYHRQVLVVRYEAGENAAINYENLRKEGHTAFQQIKAQKWESLTIVNHTGDARAGLAFLEGLALTTYQFLKYFTDADQRIYKLTGIAISDQSVTTQQIRELQNVLDATMKARSLVNEPASFLTATQLSKEIQKLGQEAGFKVEVFNKKKIETLKMGGLLAVNQGSTEPPTFTILEWKPDHPKNNKPIILVGKGIVYDTGGLSLKPTKGSMDIMKCDMGGAAAVIGTMYAVAKNKLPLHVIALVPSTDNRPGLKAYAPGDVVKMHSGKTVEVLNTDAEGRMILADALSYAGKYKPELVFDAATLTGSAALAVGRYAMVCMGTAQREIFEDVAKTGHEVGERVVKFPLWNDFEEEIKSTVADIKNLGRPEAGAITAGKFLEHFTSYPWIHFDIAGPAWLDEEDSYRGQGGSGVGVRLFYHYLQNRI